jgi:hypothetical protein
MDILTPDTATATPAMAEQQIPQAPTTGMTDAIPDQDGVMGSSSEVSRGVLVFEDYFPPLELSEEDEKAISSWFDRDLRSCMKNINTMRDKWATYRAAFMLEYVEKFYPDMGLGAPYSSGLLCEKILEGMDRIKRSVWGAHPLFAPDLKTSGSDLDISFVHRAQWCLHTMLTEHLGIKRAVGNEGMFDFVCDGSLILEVDNIYEKVPQRTLKTYDKVEDLSADSDKAIDDAHYEQALADLTVNGIAKMLVEEDIVVENGMKIFRVDKQDHLIPEGVESDEDIRFRARRMYLTKADLTLLCSEDVGWYKKEGVEKVLGTRLQARSMNGMAKEPAEIETLNRAKQNYDLGYHWEEEDSLTTGALNQPYEETFSVYRVLCKFGYKTKRDKHGKIPKYVLIDYSPEGCAVLRAVTYPHFKERPNYFHLKLGYAPKSYYGFGYGARCLPDDQMESNAVSLYLESSALASFNPFLCKHPEAGGRFPWPNGYGPGKVGYLNDPMNDFKQVQIAAPSDGLLRHILPLTQTRSANRTSITPISQGQAESTDPRSPAQKTAMLLGQSNIGLDVMVDDWNEGWTELARFIWNTAYELATCELDSNPGVAELCFGLVSRDTIPTDVDNMVTLAELKKDLKWESLASADYLNPELRAQRFMQMFQFFVPLLQQLAQFNPDMYKVYFVRWMQRAAMEFDLPGMKFLIPSKKEIDNIPAQGLQGMLEGIMTNVRAGQPPQMAKQPQQSQGGNA